MRADRRMAATVAIAAFVLLSTDGAAQDTGADLHFSTGVEYSTGQYGGPDDIDELYVPFTLRAGFDGVGLRLTVPWLNVTAPKDAFIGDADSEPLPGNGATVSASGLGDVLGAVTFYDLYVSDKAGVVVDATGKIKFGTADAREGLGTGENDYTVQFDAYQFFDRLTLHAVAGYRFRGDPPGVDLNDVFLASAGGAYLASRDSLVGIYFDYRQSAIGGIDDIQELSGFASFRLSKAWRMELYVFTGLTDSSTDFGGGILFSTDLNQLRVSERQDY